MKWLALVLLAMVAMFSAPRADATTTCSITSVTGLAFGAVNPSGTQVDTTATLSYQCTYTGSLLGSLYGSYVTLCPSIGVDDLGSFAPRTMITANSDRMQYQAYKDSGRTSIWGTVGNATYAPPTINQAFGILSNGVTLTGSVVVYGRVPVPQPLLSPGSYTGSLPTSLTYSANEVLLTLGGFPATCDGGGTSAARTATGPLLMATAAVSAQCAFGTATDLNFGSVSGFLRTNTDQTALLRITCTNRAAYQLGLDNGQNAGTTGLRRMYSGTGYVTYELYRDSQRTLRWGIALNTDTATGSGTGSEQTVTVYGRVPVQTPVRAASYSDIVTVTVTY